MISAAANLISDLAAVGYTSFIVYLIDYLKDEKAETKDGILLVLAFGSLMITSLVSRNYYVFYGYMVSVRIRKTLIAAMYTKVSKLSMKSLTSTNSGKLITIVSGDI